MFPLKLIGAAIAGGVALGVWGSSAVKEKLGGGGFKKVNKKKVTIVEIPEGKEIKDVQVFVQREAGSEEKS